MDSRMQIMAKTGKRITECTCSSCKQMCSRQVCIGTPDDILKIAEAGYAHLLVPTTWAAGIYAGIPPIQMVQLSPGANGCCMFENGLCKLHDKGLKPTEGVLAHHSNDPTARESHVTVATAKTWTDDRHYHTVLKIIDLILKTKDLND